MLWTVIFGVIFLLLEQ